VVATGFIAKNTKWVWGGGVAALLEVEEGVCGGWRSRLQERGCDRRLSVSRESVPAHSRWHSQFPVSPLLLLRCCPAHTGARPRR
jgi:hypothetical protein